MPKAGGMRRKKKAVHKTASSDDKKLVTTLKRLNVSTIPGIEEVNMFKDNGEVRTHLPSCCLLCRTVHPSVHVLAACRLCTLRTPRYKHRCLLTHS